MLQNNVQYSLIVLSLVGLLWIKNALIYIFLINALLLSIFYHNFYLVLELNVLEI